MLRKIRVIAAIIFFVAITFIFVDWSGLGREWFGWMAKIQFLPAVMALNFAVIAGLLVLTLIFGRIYCSVICPLGVMQDVFGWVGKRFKKNRYTSSKAHNWLRYSVLAMFIIAMLLGAASFVALLAPYSAYGRIAHSLTLPENSLGVMVVAGVTAVVLFVLAFRGGRTYCNNICPVGTVLGFFARFSLFKIVINTSKCVGCTLCAKNCKASCINAKEHKIDYSRCVVCGDCIEKCGSRAISYKVALNASKAISTTASTSAVSSGRPQQADTEVDTKRRSYIAIAGALLVGSALKAKNVPKNLLQKAARIRKNPIVPPGAQSVQHLTKHCTACQLCVAACPNKVLRPSDELLTFMQPRSSYEKGFCKPDCTKCSEVCPTGAIKKLTVEEKSVTKIGTAVWSGDNCLVLTKGIKCGICAIKCPKGAIEMLPQEPEYEGSPKTPHVNAELCIGCGACENICPAKPLSAIYVEGL